MSDKYVNDLTDGTGMLSSREVMTYDERKTFIMDLISSILKPTLEVVSSMSENALNMDRLSMIMATFSSIKVDVELHNLSILEDNQNTIALKNIYRKYNFYMINALPAFNRENDELVVLFEFYKKIETNPLDFLNEMKRLNTQLIGYLYIAQLVGLAHKNYKNKFILANRARTYFYNNKKDMSMESRDKASIAMAQMALDYHTNSLIIEHLTDHGYNTNHLTQSFINSLKDSPFILYDTRYKYDMSQIDILDELLKDADIEFFRGTDVPPNIITMGGC